MTSVSQRGSIEMLIHPVCRKALNECFCKVSSNCFLRIEYFQIIVKFTYYNEFTYYKDPELNIIKKEKISSGSRSLEHPWQNIALVRHTQCVLHTRRSHHFTTVVSILSFPTFLSSSSEVIESQDSK